MGIKTSTKALEWGFKHKPHLVFASGVAITRITTAILYVLLPIAAAMKYGEWVSGIFLGACNLFQALLGDTIAGNLSDRINSKNTVLLGVFFTFSAGLLWFFLPLTNTFALFAVALLLFAGYSLRDEALSYLLRTSEKAEGGTVFGVAENIFAIGTFLSSLLIPYFILTDRQKVGALFVMATALFAALLIVSVPADHIDDKKRSEGMFNPFSAIRKGWHFVRSNGYFPVLSLSNAIFEGVFYGTIWLIIPLHIASTGSGGILASLGLGVYEIVTIFLAGYAGYLADRYDWVRINAIGWIVAIIGVVGMFFSASMLWFVICGIVIAIGNNLFAFAASHALEAHDIDHPEDGSFIGLNNLVTDVGYGISPIIAGFLYYRFGFTASLWFAIIATLALGITMIWFARKKSRST